MASITKKIIFSLLLLITTNLSFAHKVYGVNDIPLLDNIFRIDPQSEQVTIILNHTQGQQRVVLVRPDGSKLYYKKHPKSVAWISNNREDIITIDNPMAGPWQAVAELNGKNRIKLISHVELKTNKLPLKLYSREYITTHASLYFDNKLMTNNAYLEDAKLSIALIGGSNKKLTLYKDDGKGYDALPFNGDLTAHIYIDLLPGRYLLNISTKNDVFIRNENKDAVVFLSPIYAEISPAEKGSNEAIFKFNVDSEEIDPESVTINGVVKDGNRSDVEQIIAHSAENISAENSFTLTKRIAYGAFVFSAKAFATTRSGREIELQLPDLTFELPRPFVAPTIDKNINITPKQKSSPSIWGNKKILIAIIVSALITLCLIGFILIRGKKKNKQAKGNNPLTLNELSFEELQPTAIDLDAPEKKKEK